MISTKIFLLFFCLACPTSAQVFYGQKFTQQSNSQPVNQNYNSADQQTVPNFQEPQQTQYRLQPNQQNQQQSQPQQQQPQAQQQQQQPATQQPQVQSQQQQQQSQQQQQQPQQQRQQQQQQPAQQQQQQPQQQDPKQQLQQFAQGVQGLAVHLQQQLQQQQQQPSITNTFPSIPGPKCLSDRIGIVGAGPSGIDMAYRLKKLGYTNVEVLEKTNRVGGKSVSIDYRGVTNTLSTYLVTPDYEDTVVALLKEFGIYNATPWRPFLRTGNNWQSPALSPEEAVLSMGDPKVLLEESRKYIDLHVSLFGFYEGELMPRPSEEVLVGQLQGSFQDFLSRNGFTVLIERLDISNTIAGYNQLHKLSAVQGLLWYTPKYLLGILSQHVLALRNKGLFQDLFDRMIQQQNINITFNYDVQYVSIKPDNYGNPTITVFPSSDTDKINFAPRNYDFLIWSGLLRDFAAKSNIYPDASPEKEILSSSFYVSASGSLVNMENDVRTATSEAYLLNLKAPQFDSNVCLSTDFYAEAQELAGPSYQNRLYAINGEHPRVRTMAVLLYGNEFRTASEDEIEGKIRKFYSEGFNATNIEILATSTFKYFPQWSIENVGRGFHWSLFEMQGRNNIWFTGGGASWDSVKSVMEYNRLLLKQSNRGNDNNYNC